MKKFLLLSLTIIGLSVISFYGYGKLNLKYKSTYQQLKKTAALELQDGDIIFQSSQSGQSLAVQLATKSKYSHVGLIYIIEGKTYVYEAVQPVKITTFNEWIKHGDGNHYIVKRLKNADKILTQEVIQKMKTAGEKYNNKDYDLYFGWSDDRIYCSELVWKIYKEATGIELGKLQQLKEFDLTHPIVQKKLKERYGNNIPYEEKVISPAAIFESEELVLVTVK